MELQKQISVQEKKIENSGQQDLAENLLQGYRQYIEQFPVDHSLNGRYLYRAAALAIRMNRYSIAVEFLHEALRNHYNSPNTLNNALLLGEVYGNKLGNPELAQTVFQATAKAFPASEEVKRKVDRSLPGLEERLEVLKEGIFSENDSSVDYRQANEFINAATLYAILLPYNRQSSYWLFEAAETTRDLRSFSLSLGLYDWIEDAWPESPEAARALFLKAVVLDSDLKRMDEARLAYRNYLEKFPADEKAGDARDLLDKLDMSEDEIMESFDNAD